MKECPQCKITFTSKDKRKKFCSQSCCATFNNKGRIISKKDRFAKCMYCNNTFELFIKKSNPKHCDECIAKNLFVRRATLESALIDGIRRKVLIRESGHKCWNCNNTEWC